MRLKTQFRIILLLFSVAVVAIAAITGITAEIAATTRAQEELANSIALEASDLSYLSNDYVIYLEPQQLERWESKFNSINDAVVSLNVDNPDQRVLVRNLQTHQRRVQEVFESVVAAAGTTNDPEKLLENFQISWSRMAIQTRGLTSDAMQLADMLRNEGNQLDLLTFVLIFLTIGSFCLFLVTVYIQTFRRTLRAIATLQTGANVIGSGNLNFEFQDDREDEIGELCKSFNQMTANLKTVTASKLDLENEVDERKRLQEQLEEAAVKLEEYANAMEQLAEDRLKKLKDSERLAAIGATAGMVGHDIRNPLQSIIGDLYLAKAELTNLPAGEAKDNMKESLQSIEDSVVYINKIVADLQDFARPLSPHFEQVNLSSVVNEVMKNGLSKKVEVSIEIADDARTVTTDSDYVKRVLGNLISNAAQAMPKGGKITLQVKKESSNVVITVEDTGVGIPEEVQTKLFTPLFTTKSKGQGFGLSVVKRMTEALGGTVTFTSQKDRGTKFIVTLPQRA